MQENTKDVSEIGALLLKALAAPGVIGVIAGAIGFLFLWPKTGKEGFIRIVSCGLCSHFFGPAVLRTIIHFAEWIPADEMQAGAYLIAGLPGWWLMAALFRYLNKGQDIKEIAGDVLDVVKK